MRYSQQNMLVASHITYLLWIEIMDREHATLILIKSISVIQDDVRVIVRKAGCSWTNGRRQWDFSPGPLGQ